MSSPLPLCRPSAIGILPFFFVESIDPNRYRPNKKPPGLSAQEVASERDVAFAVR